MERRVAGWGRTLLPLAVALGGLTVDEAHTEASDAGRAFALAALEAERAKGGREYLEFLRVPSLSMGLYVLAAGADDQQRPHQQDEVYHVVRGRAVLSVEGREHPVQPGSVVFVAAGARHRFHSIAEELSALVFFAPAETE